jgi:hypothetical protein
VGDRHVTLGGAQVILAPARRPGMASHDREELQDL